MSVCVQCMCWFKDFSAKVEDNVFLYFAIFVYFLIFSLETIFCLLKKNCCGNKVGNYFYLHAHRLRQVSRKGRKIYVRLRQPPAAVVWITYYGKRNENEMPTATSMRHYSEFQLLSTALRGHYSANTQATTQLLR